MSIYRGSQKVKELRFGGSQKIKEAYVGSQLVFKGGWDAAPIDGVMFTPDGKFVNTTGISYISTSKRWSIARHTSATITDIIFGSETTQFTMTPTRSTGFEIKIDGESIGNITGITTTALPIPSKFINDSPHTITVKNNADATAGFTDLIFNI